MSLFGIDPTTYEVWRGTPIQMPRRLVLGKGQRRNRRRKHQQPKSTKTLLLETYERMMRNTPRYMKIESGVAW